MSINILQKSIDLLDEADGLPTSSSTIKDSKNAKRRKRRQIAYDREIGVEHRRSAFLPKSKSKIKSTVEQYRERPRIDHLKRNLRYMQFSDQRHLDENKLNKILRIHNLPYTRKKRAIELARAKIDPTLKIGKAKIDKKKKKHRSVFTENDFKAWSKTISSMPKRRRTETLI